MFWKWRCQCGAINDGIGIGGICSECGKFNPGSPPSAFSFPSNSLGSEPARPVVPTAASLPPTPASVVSAAGSLLPVGAATLQVSMSLPPLPVSSPNGLQGNLPFGSPSPSFLQANRASAAAAAIPSHFKQCENRSQCFNPAGAWQPINNFRKPTDSRTRRNTCRKCESVKSMRRQGLHHPLDNSEYAGLWPPSSDQFDLPPVLVSATGGGVSSAPSPAPRNFLPDTSEYYLPRR